MAGLLDFAARFGTEERCIEHLAELRWPGGLFRLRRGGGWATEGAPAGLRMRHLPAAGIGDGGNRVSSDADGSREVVSCRLPDGSRPNAASRPNFCSANWGWHIRRPGPW